jgi:hypothetical protein
VKLAPCPAGPTATPTKGLPIVLNNHMDVKVFPNPTTSSFNLQVTDDGSKDVIQARIFDLQGRIIKTIQLNGNESIFLGADLKSGVYMLEVIKGMEKKVMRVVKY